jgi:bifunctional enzyme CysN/CysC
MIAVAENDNAILEYLQAQENKSFLRFLTCGSVDDGKSTLIGRLLYDSKLLFEDHLASLERDSRKYGTTGEDIDFALLVDGLEAEREQGITIDVAYRFFATDKRKYIVADTPGHEQYTRNMATGASTADVAVILIDSRKGVLTQTRRHSYIVSLLGIKHVVLAVNKIDLVDYNQEVFNRIVSDYKEFSGHFGFETLQAIPMSARFGDNVTLHSDTMPWYKGPSLIEYLDNLDIGKKETVQDFRFPVQWVNRPDLDFRGYSGTVAGGSVRPGDKIIVAQSNKEAVVERIVTMDGDLDKAIKGDAVTLTLDREIDISRGDILSDPDRTPIISDQFAAHIIWMGDEHLIPARPYLLKIGRRTVPASITSIKHRVDINSFSHLAARSLELNEVGLCHLCLDKPIAFDTYAENDQTGSFILIDRFTNATVAAGVIDKALRRMETVQRQNTTIDANARASLKNQKPAILWFTGLSGSGKWSIVNKVEQKLFDRHCHTYVLDGDNLRYGLNRDLGFTEEDRAENIRRAAEVGRLLTDAGLIVLASFISPSTSDRAMARDLFNDGDFIEIYVDVPLDIAEQRDPRGLYAMARQGKIKNFTGIDAAYEIPQNPELHLDAASKDADTLSDIVVEYLERNGFLS